MYSDIYSTIINRKIDNFVNTFSKDSNSIFKSSSNRLIHPGEFGMYREACCKELLRLFLRKDICISDGFIISSNNQVSTQCDIVAYNYDLSPLVENDIAKIFPVEEVKGIGEIKSDLNITMLSEALLKLAKVKQFQESRKGLLINKQYKGEGYNDLVSFLICNKINGLELAEINFEKIYGDIPRKFWHNAILSLEDGLITYLTNFSALSAENQKVLVDNGADLKVINYSEYPYLKVLGEVMNNKVSCLRYNKENFYAHILQFFVSISNAINSTNTYNHNQIDYLGLSKESFFNW